MSQQYLYYPSNASSQAATITSNKKKKDSRLSPAAIWITAFIIIIIVIIIAVIIGVSNTSKSETIKNPVESEIVNLDNLIDLDSQGLCCRLPSQALPSVRYIYDPNSNYTYGTTPTSPNVVCQNSAGQDKNVCLAFVSNSDGSAKPLAHKGITVYYAFVPGKASSVCEDYISCK